MPRPSVSLVGVFVALGVLTLLLGACRTEGPDTTTSAAEGDTTAAPADSPTTDTTALKHPPPAPAPGTAHVRAEITSCDAAATPVRCRVTVAEVLDYGSATPPLNPGEHTLALAASVLRDRPPSALTAMGPRVLVIRHAGDRPTLGDDANTTRPEWTLQSIE